MRVTLIRAAICYGVPLFTCDLGAAFNRLQHFVLPYSEAQFRMPVVNHDSTFKKNLSFKKVKYLTAVLQGISLCLFFFLCRVHFSEIFFSSLLVVINTVLVLYLYSGKIFAVIQTQYKCLRPFVYMWYSTVPEIYQCVCAHTYSHPALEWPSKTFYCLPLSLCSRPARATP